MKKLMMVMALVVFGAIVTQVAYTDESRLEGRYRVYLLSGKVVEGDLVEQEDGSYEVKGKFGIVMTIRRNQVREIVPMDKLVKRPGGEAPGQLDWAIEAGIRREISKQEIEEVLSGITAEVDPEIVGVRRSDLMAELPLDEDSLLEMIDEAGLTHEEGMPVAEHENVLLKDHFVMVYTADDESARKLGSRLESLWRWNVKFMKMLELPAQLPEAKLELFYFADQQEFDRHAKNQGFNLPMGVLGYYAHRSNRLHFFDMKTWPPIARYLKLINDDRTHWRKKQKWNNLFRRYYEFKNIEVIQHETGHVIHFNTGVFPRDFDGGLGVPTWLVEGTTQLFEFPPSKAGASLGVLNHYRLHQLRQIYPREFPKEYIKAFIIDNGRWQGGRSYPLAWALTYYLWKKHRDGYAEYLRQICGREVGFEMSMTEREAEFEDIFGRIDDDWVEDFQDFMDGLHVKRSTLPPIEL